MLGMSDVVAIPTLSTISLMIWRICFIFLEKLSVEL